MAEKLLTDKELRSAKAGDKEYLLADGGSLYARVRRAVDGSATLTWQYFFKWEGKTERLSIGPYPAVSLLSARQRRDEARAQLKSDPPQHPVLAARQRVAAAQAKVSAEAAERTVRQLYDDWHQVYLAHHRKDGGARVLECLEHDVFPFIGHRRARTITRADISAVLDRMLARDVRRKANVILALLKQMFAHGVVRGYVDADPTYAFTKKHAGGKERSRERVLSVEELQDLAKRLPQAGLGDARQAAVRFLLATGARVGEFNKARWADISANVWTIPKEHSKNGREHQVHLSAFAQAQLEILAGLRVNDWLMPSRKDDAPIDEKALSKALRDRQLVKPLKNRSAKHVGALRLAGGDWSPHDLRRTFATRLADLAVPPHVIERCLNHTMQGVMAVYNRNDYLPERRAALDAWGVELERIFTPAESNILDLTPRLTAKRRGARK